jgi:hypothetical protein
VTDLLREATQRFARVPAPEGWLQGLHGLKLSAGRAYEAASLVAPGSQRKLYETLAEHEREHAKVVATMLGALAAKQPRRPEAEDVAALAGGIGRMTEAKLLQSFLTIAAADGQHRAALRLALGEDPVPKPFS